MKTDLKYFNYVMPVLHNKMVTTFTKLNIQHSDQSIIELGNDLIVSLGEKNYRDENRIHNKCIIKIFSKLNINSKNSEANSFLSDYIIQVIVYLILFQSHSYSITSFKK